MLPSSLPVDQGRDEVSHDDERQRQENPQHAPEQTPLASVHIEGNFMQRLRVCQGGTTSGLGVRSDEEMPEDLGKSRKQDEGHQPSFRVQKR